jgi:general secretion pathway protein A
MYKEYFDLKDLPFSIAPDPRYLYMSARHREALAHLVYGITVEGGFVLLTGEVGTGKTTLCRCLLEQIPQDTDIAFILNPRLSVQELLATICDELGISYPSQTSSIKVFIDLINAYLLAAYAKGRKTVLIIEEAQNLTPDVLEQIRLLTNLETNERKLLQVVMVGQPELRDLLSRPELRQLAQRITARYHLEPLSREGVSEYVHHRLSVAGARTALLPASLMGTLYRSTGGIPRLINLVCDRALLGVYAEGKDHVTRRILKKAAREVFGVTEPIWLSRRWVKWAFAPLLLLGICVGALAGYYYYQKPSPQGMPGSSHIAAATADSGKSRIGTPLAWPSELPMAQSRELSYRALFDQWGITYRQNGGDECAQARQGGLRCLDAKGDFRSLVLLNRPAVVKLLDAQGQQFFAALIGYSGRTASLVVGTQTLRVRDDDLKRHWAGTYTVLWRPPREYEGTVYPSQKAKIARWLDSHLAALRGRQATPHRGDTYDDRLVKEVREFQETSGLTPDGVVGPETVIHLQNQAGGEDVQLATAAEAKHNVIHP